MALATSRLGPSHAVANGNTRHTRQNERIAATYEDPSMTGLLLRRKGTHDTHRIHAGDRTDS